MSVTSGSAALRALAQTRTQHGKASSEYADAVGAFLERVVNPRTGEIVGQRGACPACAQGSELLGVAFRLRAGCPLCDDTGLACPVCRNAGWIGVYPPGVDPTDPTDNRPSSPRRCPACVVGDGDGRLVADGLRRLQALAAWYRAGERP